jgi:predicted nucleotidyltransferase
MAERKDRIAPIDLARRVTDHLAAVEGVVAVVLGGSWARGGATTSSDVDLGIYYHPHGPPSLDALRSIAGCLDDRHTADAVTEFGAWGPWINGGAWLRIEGTKVDWLYRDLTKVRHSIDESSRGQVAVYYQPGHPFGFTSYLYMGEIDHCVPLSDPQGEIASLKRRSRPYPAVLKRAIVDRFSWEAGFALETARSSAERGDVSYVNGCLFRSASCLVQVLCALNEHYLINEKQSLTLVDDFPLGVPRFKATVEEILGHPGTSPADLRESLRRMDEITASVRTLVIESGTGA